MENILEYILTGTWLNQLLTLLMQLVMILVGIILLPISALIKTLIPNLDDGLSKVSTIFDYASTYMSWIFSAFAVPSVLITIMVGYYSFVLTSKFALFTFKIGLQWYRTFKT